MDFLKKTVAIDFYLKVSEWFALHARVLREESNSWTQLCVFAEKLSPRLPSSPSIFREARDWVKGTQTRQRASFYFLTRVIMDAAAPLSSAVQESVTTRGWGTFVITPSLRCIKVQDSALLSFKRLDFKIRFKKKKKALRRLMCASAA